MKSGGFEAVLIEETTVLQRFVGTHAAGVMLLGINRLERKSVAFYNSNG
jgi:hypothetical protein